MGKAMEDTGSTKLEGNKKPWWLNISSGWIILLVVVIGVLYVVYFLHLLRISDNCRAFVEASFFQECLSKLPANEIGDTLGGAFAPLAFIFLAGALVIQAMELAAQRYEINETQQVMQAQLKVARQQVEETRASTTLLLEQTDFFRNQREQELANRRFDAQFDLFLKMLLSFKSNMKLKIWQLEPSLAANGDHEPHYSHRIKDFFRTNLKDESDEGLISVLLLSIALSLEDIRHPAPHVSVGFADEKSEIAFTKLREELQTLHDILPSLTPDYEIKSRKLKIPMCYWAYLELFEGLAKSSGQSSSVT